MSSIYSDRSRVRQNLLSGLCLVNETFRYEARRRLWHVIVLRSEDEAQRFLATIDGLNKVPQTTVLVLSGPMWGVISGKTAARVLKKVNGVVSLVLGNVDKLDPVELCVDSLVNLKLLRVEQTATFQSDDVSDGRDSQAQYINLPFNLDSLVLFSDFDANRTSIRLVASLAASVEQSLFIKTSTYGGNPMSRPKLPTDPLDLRPFKALFTEDDARYSGICDDDFEGLTGLRELYLFMDDEAQYPLLEPLLQKSARSKRLRQVVTSMPHPLLFQSMKHSGNRTKVSKASSSTADANEGAEGRRLVLTVQATSPEDYTMLADSFVDESVATRNATRSRSFIDDVTDVEIVRPRIVEEPELVRAVEAVKALGKEVFVL
ncbi:hypothetical protein OIO90_002678 [Microbotryomycetes sp. JL221]|nr:hypothetical protein OIO90_002678 [Microbotryomycetes sp. JL221]